MKTKTYWTKNKFTGEETGPFSFKEIATLIWQGDLNRHDFVKSSDADQWVKAGSLLEEIFLKVEARKRTESEGRGFASVPQVVENKSKPKGNAASGDSRKAMSSKAIQVRQSRRITFFGLVFGSFKASPYAGFWLMKLLINILILLNLVGLVCIILFYFGFAFLEPLTQNSPEEDFFQQMQGQNSSGSLYANLMSAGLASAFSILGATITTISLIFFRNMIDWLIDMEDHANAIRQQTIN
jgi:hypothetical protein